MYNGKKNIITLKFDRRAAKSIFTQYLKISITGGAIPLVIMQLDGKRQKVVSP